MKRIFKFKKIFSYEPVLLRWAMWPMGLLFVYIFLICWKFIWNILLIQDMYPLSPAVVEHFVLMLLHFSCFFFVYFLSHRLKIPSNCSCKNKKYLYMYLKVLVKTIKSLHTRVVQKVRGQLRFYHFYWVNIYIPYTKMFVVKFQFKI